MRKKEHNQQLFQVQNILETLDEATEHFSKLIKEKELNQSIFIFSSIVDGCNALMQILQHYNEEAFSTALQNIERHVLAIAKNLEAGHLMKVAEIVQFSFRPSINKLYKQFIEVAGNQKPDKKIAIGIFHSLVNPVDFETEARMKATLAEAEKQAVNLYFFTSSDVDLDHEKVTASVFQDREWKKVTTDFPDVIHNINSQKKTFIERQLRRRIPFTSFSVGNKFTLPQRMLRYRTFAELLVPFRVCMDKEGIYSFIDKHAHVVFKALKSNRGENIYFLTKKGNRYVLLDQKKESILNQETLDTFLDQIILYEKSGYIVQRYIHTRTKADEPYHFRAHVQKNGEGSWQLTHIYPRIGNKKSNLSNISTEGRVEDFPTFLKKEYGEKEGISYENKILSLSIDVAVHLDKLYGNVLNELGLDFAIDDHGRIWMHEANNGPQTAFHEEKRAIYMIAYAKYIAANGIVHKQIVNRQKFSKSQFQADYSKVPLIDMKDKHLIGVLTQNLEDATSSTFAADVRREGCAVYYFSPEDLDLEEMLVRGSYYDDDQWKTGVFEYPDLILDLIKAKTNPNLRGLYEELEHIKFNNDIPSSLFSRTNIMELLNTKGIIVQFQKVTSPRHVFQYLERFSNILIRSNNIELYQAIAIKTNGKEYIVQTSENERTYSEMQLRNYLKDLLEKESFIVLEDTRPAQSNLLTATHVHMIKNEAGNWEAIENYEVTYDYTEKRANKKIIHHAGELAEPLLDFITSALVKLEEDQNQKLHEALFILDIENTSKISLLDLNPNGPAAIEDSVSYSKGISSHLKYLVNTLIVESNS